MVPFVYFFHTILPDPAEKTILTFYENILTHTPSLRRRRLVFYVKTLITRYLTVLYSIQLYGGAL